MAIIKAYTDIEQSRKLAEILPLETADMRYHTISHYNPYPCDEIVYTIDFGKASGKDIPCWSLAALIGVLPTLDDRNANFCKDIRYDKWHVYYHSTATLSIIDTERYNNLVDACYEMILKLHERKML